MLFNSFEFLCFLPLVFLLYWFIFNKTFRRQNLLLLAASYFFYAWWSWKFLLLLAFCTFLDYVYGFSVASPNRNKARIFLWLSIVNNLGILAVFKYYNFFAFQLHLAFEKAGIHVGPMFLNLVLPVGISFYTFHGMSYVFDIYRGKQKPVLNFVDYAVFVAFFPLLVAGPIERAHHFLPQVQRKRFFNYTQAVEGGKLMLWGMFKKVVIADTLSEIVNNAFKDYHHFSGVSLVIAATAFSFQIYGDFSGYSDIAIGVARLFGFELLSNFKFPYFSRDVAEFWRRWHISLSSWFRDYLYIPLGGSKQGKLKTVRNIFIIFIVSGFWHGASWNYIIWGGIHACGFLPLLLLNRNRKHVTDVVAENSKFPDFKEVLQMSATFIFVTIAWVFFRANGVSQAVGYLKQIVLELLRHPGRFFVNPVGLGSLFICITPLLLGDWWMRRNERQVRMTNIKALNWLIMTALAVFVLNTMLGYLYKAPSTFIYFQF